MNPPLAPPQDRDETPFELRWSQWRANAVFQDALWHRRATATALLLGVGIAAWLAVALYLD